MTASHNIACEGDQVTSVKLKPFDGESTVGTDKRAYLYVALSTGVLKVGVSRKPRSRLRTLALQSGRVFKSVFVAGPFWNAHLIEGMVLERFGADRAASSEWVRTSYAELSAFCETIVLPKECTVAPPITAMDHPLFVSDFTAAVDGVFHLEVVNEEPRVRDEAIASRLGFKRPRDIRKLIERNLNEFKGLGACATVARLVAGQTVNEYWLNEEQALLAAALSDAPKSAAVRAALIRAFVAW